MCNVINLCKIIIYVVVVEISYLIYDLFVNARSISEINCVTAKEIKALQYTLCAISMAQLTNHY